MSGFLSVPRSVVVAPGVVTDLGLHALMLGVMASTMIIAPSAGSALLGAAVLIAASVPCAPIARRSASGWRHIVDLWAMAGLLLVAATSVSPAEVVEMGGMGSMGGMAHGAGMVLASPSTGGLAVVAGWLACRLLLMAGAVRRGERMGRLGLGSAGFAAVGFDLMLAFH